MEGNAVRTAALVFVLSTADAEYLSKQFPDAIQSSNFPQVLSTSIERLYFPSQIVLPFWQSS
jgi:hypothetical protein